MIFPQNILSLIPQKPPFVMVGKLLHSNENSTQTTFMINEANVLVANGEFTEAGLMENIAQTAAARAGYIATMEDRPVGVGYIGSVKNFEVFALPQINDELITEVKIENQMLDVAVISGSVSCNGRLMAKCEMNIFISR
jgi:predicted hotdog family 3-hydroxylacyl-ACP dehydratase